MQNGRFINKEDINNISNRMKQFVLGTRFQTRLDLIIKLEALPEPAVNIQTIEQYLE